MTKNKILYIKIIFKIYLKISQKHFKFSNRYLFYKNQKTVFKSNFENLFLKTTVKVLGIVKLVFSKYKFNTSIFKSLVSSFPQKVI